MGSTSGSFYFVLFIICTFQTVSGQVNEAACAACTKKLNGTSDAVRMYLAQHDPMYLNTPKPCHPCKYTGLTPVALYGEVCPVKVMVNGETCYNQNISLIFDRTTLSCNCTLPVNPTELLNLMSNLALNPQQLVNCTESGEVPFDASAFGEEIVDEVTVAPINLMDLAECSPVLTGTLNPLQKPLPSEVEVGISVVVVNQILDIIIRVCSSNVTVVSILNRKEDPKQVTFTCNANEDVYKDPCACFEKNDYMKKLTTSTIRGLYECYRFTLADKDSNLLEQESCLEYV